ncbi:MAG: GNAT family N-acetyltransferase [Hoeflea sp.]|uniref:GNAT family N-acetyltransferase n=1 Tax=Hoeflea sp. TaxID=1940281 RepID=UPI001D617A28|nr:GNAT family N-acetyltransferase [Hoeflea sp.]MBU4528678.1 GNAT family N-acetyltransferase [Alphaproteobacteria bacterium]MBU4545517.1 GNAT family N-acetyltransferase [Alphaproteobacteria bacterium]MBU4552127.1 GNAT family N-acetyltransferase [Alphaproteobacteria bacterium]MBV1726281.1 GNAT family N-acetyltransferase [Hoeflea sp.]MBV1762292.1 GNAT family N-acetyltransferase [Hoeflea sp.]
MASSPIVHEEVASQANTLIGEFAQVETARPLADHDIAVGRPGRRLAIYPARAGYELQEELDFLTNRAMEPNIFFSGRFLAPAMPRLEDRVIRLMLMRDETDTHSRMRLMLPFSVERPGFSVGAPIIRAWANPFGPLGTPLLDREDAAETLDNMFEALGRPQSGLPGILVLPDMRLNGPVAALIRAVAAGRNLSVAVTDELERPFLESTLDGEAYLARSVSRHHRHEMRRQWRRLSEHGELTYMVARQPDEIRYHLEEFLTLEDSGWKGRRKSAMVADRYRAAFAREAINSLAEVDSVRIHSLALNGEPIASMIVFISSGEAWTWKTAYDETYARYSPGKLLVDRLTEWHLDDLNIRRTDSCAIPDHPVMSRMWTERETIGTMVIGLDPRHDRDVRQVATQLHIYRNTRNIARLLREKIRGMARC